jgi:hypothetical protein
MNRFLKILIHLIVIVFLTIITQVGGVIYGLSVFFFRNKSIRKQFLAFTIIYLLFTFLIVPVVAPVFGREKIKESFCLEAKSVFYKFTNRNYVTPELNFSLTTLSNELVRKNKNLKLIYLDANFPFFNGFPLLPHLSHNDGKKIDISLVYEDSDGKLTNKKPSVSGYGVYSGPTKREYNQPEVCRKKGKWQYDFPKYLTLGTVNKDLKFSNKWNRILIELILKNDKVGKLFVEPHLKSRLGFNNKKIRFHGCQAVRHDDHIHFQLR